jgi:hypothetical protein
MGLICDLDSPSLVFTTRRTNSRRVELDTPIVPRAVAEAVWEEACVHLGTTLPRRWIMELTTRAEEIYHHSPHFRKLLRSRGNACRDYLWSFTRHWLAALISKYRPNFAAKLPSHYKVGRDPRHLQTETAAELDALLPAIPDRAFKGRL